jgi:hypothetical protein
MVFGLNGREAGLVGSGEYTALLRYVFILHVIVAGFFGVWLMALPSSFNAIIGWTYDPTNHPYGAALVAIAFTSLAGFRVKEWVRVKIVVEMELVHTVLGMIVGLYVAFNTTYPMFVWIYTGIMALFFVLFLVSYYQNRKA